MFFFINLDTDVFYCDYDTRKIITDESVYCDSTIENQVYTCSSSYECTATTSKFFFLLDNLKFYI